MNLFYLVPVVLAVFIILQIFIYRQMEQKVHRKWNNWKWHFNEKYCKRIDKAEALLERAQTAIIQNIDDKELENQIIEYFQKYYGGNYEK